MTSLRILVSLIATLPVCHRSLTAQDKADSSSDTTPRLGGVWQLTSSTGAGPYTVTIVQMGNKLRADMYPDVRCSGTDVRMAITLEGDVHGRAVRLRATRGRIESGRIDTDLAEGCAEYQVLANAVDFQGQLSADGKNIVGPYDYTGNSTHIWRFRR
jgi:hypothetical protein